MKNICIYGADSIGGFLACSLKKTNSKITLIARGAHKQVIKSKGLTLFKNGKSETFKFDVTEDTTTLGTQDYIFICDLKKILTHYKSVIKCFIYKMY